MSRFDVAAGYPFPRRTSKICVTTSVWHRAEFLDFAYLSLRSQWALTDVELADVKVFVEPSLMTQAKERLAGFALELVPLEVPYSAYAETLHPAARGYDWIVRVDADAYFCGTRGSFYGRLAALDLPAWTAWNGFDPLATLRARRSLSRRFRDADDDSYLEVLGACVGLSAAELVHAFSASPWCYGYVQCLSGELVASESWRRTVEECRERLATTCHESVFLAHTRAHGIPVGDLRELPGIRFAVDDVPQALGVRGNDLLVLHPMPEHGDRFLRAVYDLVLGRRRVSRIERLRARARLWQRRRRRARR